MVRIPGLLIVADRPPFWRERRSGRAVYQIKLDCGHFAGLASEGTEVFRRKCSTCAELDRTLGSVKVYGRHGTCRGYIADVAGRLLAVLT